MKGAMMATRSPVGVNTPNVACPVGRQFARLKTAPSWPVKDESRPFRDGTDCLLWQPQPGRGLGRRP
jgi:hypothetical protein